MGSNFSENSSRIIGSLCALQNKSSGFPLANNISNIIDDLLRFVSVKDGSVNQRWIQDRAVKAEYMILDLTHISRKYIRIKTEEHKIEGAPL